MLCTVLKGFEARAFGFGVALFGEMGVSKIGGPNTVP